MKHSSSRELFAYWDKCRGRRLAPERGDIDPGGIRRALGDTFILALDDFTGHPFRLAGTRVCAVFGGELKSEAFLDLFDASARNLMAELLATFAAETLGAVAHVRGENEDGANLDLELLLLPLTQRGRKTARFIGTLAPMQMPYWLGIKPIGDLVMLGFRHVGPGLDRMMPTPPMAVQKRLPHGFVVHAGGRQD